MLDDAVAVMVTVVRPCDVAVVAVSQGVPEPTFAVTELPVVKLVEVVPLSAR
jgi:hypothetical protein